MTTPAHPPRILVVDDDEGLLVLMEDALRAEGYEVVAMSSGRAAWRWLDHETPDLMLLDLKMRDVDGPVLLDRLKKKDTPVPFIIVTGQGDEKVAVDVMKKGALDYVMKNTALLDLLPSVVKRTLEITSQKKALLESQANYLRLESEVLEMGERERRRIGSDLHDGLGQQLTAIELLCAGLKADLASVQPSLANRVERISGMLREAVTQTRYLSRGLVPVDRGPDALQAGLTELAERTDALAGVSCRLECNGAVMVPDPVVSGHLYRIAQEAINNALKHSKAKHLTVRLWEKDGAVSLEISDDGVGLRTEMDEKKGLGLGVMQHRAHVIGAQLVIRSKRGEGVAVLCTLPVKS